MTKAPATEAPAPIKTAEAPAPIKTTEAPAPAKTTEAPAPAKTTRTTEAPAPAKTTEAPTRSTLGLVRLRAGDSSSFLISRATLAQSPYLTALVSRWSGVTGHLEDRETHELDVDGDSLRALITLMRYGPGAVPSLSEPLRVKVVHDADYLGLPSQLWSHLVRAEEDPEREHARDRRMREVRLAMWFDNKGQLSLCGGCTRYTAFSVLTCAVCALPVAENAVFRPSTWRRGKDTPTVVHECAACGPAFVRRTQKCLACHIARSELDF